jgi:hypothetical protein
MTGDEILVYLEIKSETIWLPADAEIRVRVKRTITSEKCTLIVFWEFTGSHTLAGFQKVTHSIHDPFVKKFLIHSLRKCSEISQKLANL